MVPAQSLLSLALGEWTEFELALLPSLTLGLYTLRGSKMMIR